MTEPFYQGSITAPDWLRFTKNLYVLISEKAPLFGPTGNVAE